MQKVDDYNLLLLLSFFYFYVSGSFSLPFGFFSTFPLGTLLYHLSVILLSLQSLIVFSPF